MSTSRRLWIGAGMAVAVLAVGLVAWGPRIEFVPSYHDVVREYVDGVLTDDRDAVVRHACTQLRDDIQDPDDFEKARERTLDSLAGPVQNVQILRGSSDIASILIHTDDGDVVHDLPIIRIDSEVQVCPEAGSGLLGTFLMDR